eukprot:6949495-Pyramimonas_sp.AAC.1
MEAALNIKLKGPMMTNNGDPLRKGKGAISSFVYGLMFSLQVCNKINIYGVLPRCERSRSSRCRFNYWDDSEPSNDERQVREFEQKLVMALHIA